MSEPVNPATVQVSRRMIHELVNHLSIAVGHSDLLLLESQPDSSMRPALVEIRDACRRAVGVVESWRAAMPPEPK